MERLSLDQICKEAAGARDVPELRAFRDRMHGEFQRHLLFASPLEWNRDANAFHDAVIRRVIELSEQDYAAAHGAAPLPYAFLLFGSGGRGEQTLWSDQDNGLIYADPATPDEEAAAEGYFKGLAEKISLSLELAGYPPCSGNVICTNAKWRKSVTAYRQTIAGWLQEPDWENVRYLLIAADLRTVYGDPAFGEAVAEEFHAYVAAHPSMLEHLLHNTLHHKVSLGLFGQLIKERYGEDAGGVDVKYGAYIPIVNGIRLLAIEAGIRSTSTEERTLALIRGGHVEEEIGHDWLEALNLAFKLRSMTPYQIIDGRYNSRGKLTAEQLTKERISELKLCLRIGIELQKYVKRSVHHELEKGQ
ncbi:DUF294 nucleotidyltransferase-like domain-containing protein [Paenibacillus mucilaginosus]|uniref:CBS domain-containing protein n=2 Tax=Paenibacillus mucilaginosus TaxID=61624 RepID=H6NJ70_9BACL|nr:DUF294 nucleotidyltransferase-like domain-containing protein [Paenibacillus mucilaginosus]AEI40185.1 protein of unknown function DUF294 nucleotidyltransferase putative [Paenibacillus mucilaginosus KNP414]AFC28832.1 hypothetical protein PM3016_1928 [Paenibacillus mucilaginosus 3016]MCG7215787.1 DUF294 nucleotidyltransferase-like domain-containing protein [Paenibacillus mucilaginosus]WDM29414.1 hypothetical protein KCX80_09745 [Paenibacillus mucilaginosus]WFA17594.1 hypothetical protein ERY13